MPDQTETCTCMETNTTLVVPLTAFIENFEGLPSGGAAPLRTWEGPWFQPVPGESYSFDHDLDLEHPWRCEPMIVGKVHTSQAGWLVDEIVFTHGSNYNGATAYTEIGWLASITENTCLVTFGNNAQFTCGKRSGGYGTLSKASVMCKMVLRY